MAGTRPIPLVIERRELDRAVALAKERGPLFSVKTYHLNNVRLVITGNEVFDGLIEDRFEAIVREKLAAFGASLLETVILPDDPEPIADAVVRMVAADTNMIIRPQSPFLSLQPHWAYRYALDG